MLNELNRISDEIAAEKGDGEVTTPEVLQLSIGRIEAAQKLAIDIDEPIDDCGCNFTIISNADNSTSQLLRCNVSCLCV